MKIRMMTLFIMILLITSCVTTLKTEHFASGRLIYRNIPLQPGAVVWSPDSTRIAAIRNNTIYIFDTITEQSRVLSKLKPLFIEWAPGNNLITVHELDGRNELAIADVTNETVESIPVQEQPDAVKWLHAPDEFIVLSTDLKRMSIGAFVTYKLKKIEGGNVEVFFNHDSYFPTLKQRFDHMSGWTFAGIRPLHGTVLIPEYHNPPRIEPYTVFKTVDPLTKEIRELYKLKDARFSIPAAWSPDGSHLAITNSKGSLNIVNVNRPDERLHTDDAIRGRFPSWNPAGSQIYIGGWIVQSDGTAVEQLIPDARESMGIWSPDGTGLAILFKNSLFYLDGFSPELH
jgi:WD40 repeat protein